MYPAQTSLIPVTVALARFLEANGSGGLYPYWYLGTTPVKYLTGPVVPYLLVYLEKLIPVFSYFELSLVLIITSFFVRAVGWGFLAGYLAKDKRIGLVVGILSLVMPWHIASALGHAETSAVFAGSITPWVLLAYARISNYKFQITNFKLWLSPIAFTLLLLTNTTAAVPAIIGMILLSITNYKLSITKLKRLLLVVLLGGVLTLWWYSPAYWLTAWGAPGIGGKNLFGVLSTFINFMRGFLPVIAALLFVFWKVKPKTVFDKFSLGWLVLFGSLTLFRFMADWDFWMDWTAWLGEVEVGLALLIAGPVARFLPASAPQLFSSKIKTPKSGSNSEKNWVRAVGNPSTGVTRNRWLGSLVIGIYLFFGWFLMWQNRGFWLPRTDIRSTAEYKIAKQLNESVNCQLSTVNCLTVFLSGTSAFWLNSLVDVKQVRGGRDEASVDSKWREAVWEVREGEYGRDSVDILKRLGVDYLVVHTDESSEYYHDFKYPDKFEGRSDLEKVYEKDGDIIYKVSGT